MTKYITGVCIEVHKHLSPGLLESVYQKCLMHELRLQEIPFVFDKIISVAYKGLKIDTLLRADILVDSSIVLEIKAVKEMLLVYEAQLLTFMKLLEVSKRPSRQEVIRVIKYSELLTSIINRSKN